MQRYYLADPHDRTRLSITGTVEAAHACEPQYFDTAQDAYKHPAAATLTVHAVPAAETVPGAGVEADFAVAADTYHAIDAVINPAVYASIAAAVHAICAGQ